MKHRTKNSDTMRGKVIVLGFLLFQILYQISGEKLSDYYTAAVVEYSPIYIKNDVKLTYEKNTDEYINYIERASKQNADIIVFPEDGLASFSMPIFHEYNDWTTVVPSSQENYIPCTESRINGIIEAVKRLSCAARDNRMYVVINVGEKRFDEKDGTWHYHNTNIVFDRIGKIIARYRKVHLALEGKYESSVPPDLVTFDTDFGVRFGVITCFDMLFEEPALNLTRIEGISNIVYPTAWLSEVPFITAIQIHSGWAYGENVNVLSAGYNKPEFGSVGSGIYLGRNGIINVTMSTNPKERLLVSRVPKTPKKIETRKKYITNQLYSKRNLHTSDIDSIKLKHDHVTWFNSTLVNNSMNETICYGNFCCDFLIRTNTIDPSTYYHAVVYDGIHVFEKILEAGVRLCAVIQCSNETLRSCTSVDPSDTTFSTLKITARFDDYSKIVVTPTVIDSSLIPFQHWSYDEQMRGEETTVTIALEEEMKNVINFGIYSRNFQRDKYYK